MEFWTKMYWRFITGLFLFIVYDLINLDRYDEPYNGSLEHNILFITAFIIIMGIFVSALKMPVSKKESE